MRPLVIVVAILCCCCPLAEQAVASGPSAHTFKYSSELKTNAYAPKYRPHSRNSQTHPHGGRVWIGGPAWQLYFPSYYFPEQLPAALAGSRDFQGIPFESLHECAEFQRAEDYIGRCVPR